MNIDVSYLPKPVDYAIPAFIVLMIVELFLGKLRNNAQYEVRDTTTSLMMGLGNVTSSLATGIVTLGASFWVYEHSIWKIPAVWWSFLILFFAEDFCYYWVHRWGHEVRWLWAAHVTHHSSQHYNLSTALRQTWTGFFSGGWLVWLPLALVGFHPGMIAFQKGISLVYQFWIHTESIKRMGPLEWVFNTPSHHRVHHATNLDYLDKNYAGILIIWDRLFGTFEVEDDDNPCEYGILKYIATFNPIKIAFHEWVGIFKDIIQQNLSLKQRFLYMFARPGWSHDHSRQTVPEMRKEAEKQESPS